MPHALFPLFLVAHIVLAISLFVPSLLLPFAFRARRGSLNPGPTGRFVRLLLALQSRGTIWIGLGLAVTHSCCHPNKSRGRQGECRTTATGLCGVAVPMQRLSGYSF